MTASRLSALGSSCARLQGKSGVQGVVGLGFGFYSRALGFRALGFEGLGLLGSIGFRV